MHVSAGACLGRVQHDEDVVGVDVHLGQRVALRGLAHRPGVQAERLDERLGRLVVPGRHVDPHRVRPAQQRGNSSTLLACTPAGVNTRMSTAVRSIGFAEAARVLPTSGTVVRSLGIVHDGVMSTYDAVLDVAERAAGVLGPESGLLQDLDAAGFLDALRRAITATATNPADSLRASVQLANDLARIPVVAGAKAFGADLEPPFAVDPKDRRFADPAWAANPFFYWIRLAYLAACRFAREVVGSAELDGPDAARKAALALDLLLDALAPDELPADEPRGAQAGVRHRRREPGRRARSTSSTTCCNNEGRPRQVDTSGFEVGRNLAVHAREGGVPQRPDGAAAVRAADRAGARHPAAVQPAVDQQVLRDGPRAGPQLHRVGRPARAHRLRDQLPQPVRTRCPAPRWTTTSSTARRPRWT